MVKIFINNKEHEVPGGISLIQACDMLSHEIPRFCYHDKLKVAGNCRMCLVEIKNMPKPVASCAIEVYEGMDVITDSTMVKDARGGVMEFLLANHPLDCPICDEGGECDLQDQAMAYGKGNSRFLEEKRAVEDKNFGPLIKTTMTRCIHCTRCVRFATDIAGVEELGAVGRGEDMEIATYLEGAVTSELSGNMIDICPVGALTSKPYAGKCRSWELKHVESIDVSDAVGSNIRVDVRGMEVVRIVPRLNEDINEEWISDKTRFMYDGLKNQRLDAPYVRKNGVLEKTTWKNALSVIKEALKGLKGNEIGAVLGDLAEVESALVLKDIMTSLKSPNMDCMQEGAYVDASSRGNYLFNTTIAGIENSDLCLMIGANPRHEATLVNARIRKRSLMGDYPVFVIGDLSVDLTYKNENLGSSLNILEQILSGKHDICKKLKISSQPIMIIGYSALVRDDAKVIMHLCNEISKKYGITMNILHTAASRVGALDIGFVPQSGGVGTAGILEQFAKQQIKFLYLLGADEINVDKLKNNGFIVYQGHHGDEVANIADVILPGAAYTEKSATYVNLEGRVQRTQKSVSPPGEAVEDWKILQMLADILGIKLKYDTIDDLRERMKKLNSVFGKANEIHSEAISIESQKGKLSKDPLQMRESKYYLTNAICRASRTMARCTNEKETCTI